MLRYSCMLLVFSLLTSGLAAPSKEDGLILLHEFMEHSRPCTEKFGISPWDLEEARLKKSLEKIDPCFIACYFKKTGLMDDKGMFIDRNMVDLAQTYIKDADDELAKIKKISETCKSVNEQPVSDGIRGCHRSMLLLKCLSDHKSQVL